MYLANKTIYRLIRKYTTRRGENRTQEIGVFTSMELASKELMRNLISIARSNIRDAVHVKGAIRGRGVASIQNLCDEVENHGLQIESIRITK